MNRNAGQSQASGETPAKERRFSWRGPLIALALTAITTAVGTILVWQAGIHRYYTDADKIHESAKTAILRDILWQPPQQTILPEGFETDVYEPYISADGLTLLFVRGKAGENADIFASQKSVEGWSPPQPLGEVNTEYDDLGPELSADNRSLYFYSNRPGGHGGYDLWVAHRGADAWRAPVNLGPAVNSEYNDYGVALAPDGTSLYFSSNRPRTANTDEPLPEAWPGTIREDLYGRTYDLYFATISDRGVGSAVLLAALNSPYNEGTPAVSPVGDFLYFASDRPGGAGGFDLYRSRLRQGRHEPADNLGLAVNTTGNELDPTLTMGGYALHFSSDKQRNSTDSDQGDSYRLFQTESREVFAEVETREGDGTWAALWRALGVGLPWGLLVLLLVLLLHYLVRGMQSRRLSLLARCLLASLALHVLLMLLLTIWEVTASIAGELGHRRGTRVALTSSGSGNALAAQIHGGFTNSLESSPASLEVKRREYQVAAQAEPAIVQLAAGRITTPRYESVLQDETLRDAAHRLPEVVTPEPRPLEDSISPMLDVATPADLQQVKQDEPHEQYKMENNTAEMAKRAPVATATLHTPTQPDAMSQPAPESIAGITRALHTPDVLPNAPDVLASADVTDALQLRVPAASTISDSELEVRLPDSAAGQRASSKEVVDTASPSATVPEPVRLANVSLFERDGQNQLSLDAPALERMTPALVDVNMGVSRLASKLSVSSAPTTPLNPSAGEIPDLPGLAVAAAIPNESDAQRQTEPQAEGTVPQASEQRVAARSLLPQPGRFAPNIIEDSIDGGERLAAHLRESSVPLEFDSRDSADDIEPVPVHSSVMLAAQSVAAELPRASDLALAVPTELTAPEPIEPADRRESGISRDFGTGDRREAIERALKWLAAHQSSDGHWDALRFDEECGNCGGAADAELNVAVTSLATLCFMGAGHTHQQEGPYRDNVARALHWLTRKQDSAGDLRDGENMYSQAMASLALVEAFVTSQEETLAEAAGNATGFIERSRNPNDDGWGVDVGAPADTSVLAWHTMALSDARRAQLPVSWTSLRAAQDWLKRVRSRSHPGRYSFQPGIGYSPATTAEGLLIDELISGRKRDEHTHDSVEFILEYPAECQEAPDAHYWFTATLALWHHQGDAWTEWYPVLGEQLLRYQ
ncbi:MAG: PD40 domain-containing protein, partial [Phycisphaerales bacterium]